MAGRLGWDRVGWAVVLVVGCLHGFPQPSPWTASLSPEQTPPSNQSRHCTARSSIDMTQACSRRSHLECIRLRTTCEWNKASMQSSPARAHAPQTVEHTQWGWYGYGIRGR
jgi:hypothetical protein